jgi:hypothetical protein
MTVNEAVAVFLSHCQYGKNLSCSKTLTAYSTDLRQFRPGSPHPSPSDETLAPLSPRILIVLVLAALSLLLLRRATARKLRRMTQDELERSVFRYEDGYFRSIGPEHPDV